MWCAGVLTSETELNTVLFQSGCRERCRWAWGYRCNRSCGALTQSLSAHSAVSGLRRPLLAGGVARQFSSPGAMVDENPIGRRQPIIKPVAEERTARAVVHANAVAEAEALCVSPAACKEEAVVGFLEDLRITRVTSLYSEEYRRCSPEFRIARRSIYR